MKEDKSRDKIFSYDAKNKNLNEKVLYYVKNTDGFRSCDF